MSIVLTTDILNLLLNKHNNEINKIINEIHNDDETIDINLIPDINNIGHLFKHKKYNINIEDRCLAKNSQNNQCKRTSCCFDDGNRNIWFK